MSLSRGTAQSIAPRTVEGSLLSSLSVGNDVPAGSSPPHVTKHDHAPEPKGRQSRSNSLAESHAIQHDLKTGGELVFASDGSSNVVLKGGGFPRLVDWVLASASAEEKAVQNFVLSYRQWKPPAELWKLVMDKCVLDMRFVSFFLQLRSLGLNR